MTSLHALKRSQLHSEQLGIELKRRTDGEYFKWFLASLLFGQRISGKIAARTYRAFRDHGLVDPRSILEAGHAFLVDPVMREGGYVRYDESKSSQILRNCQTLLDRYDGSLTALHDEACSPSDLEKRIAAFHGIGPVTVNIFLRELRPHWKKANPGVLPAVREQARELRIDLDAFDRKSVVFTRLEAGLLNARRK
jgi:endonuclease III